MLNFRFSEGILEYLTLMSIVKFVTCFSCANAMISVSFYCDPSIRWLVGGFITMQFCSSLYSYVFIPFFLLYFFSYIHCNIFVLFQFILVYHSLSHMFHDYCTFFSFMNRQDSFNYLVHFGKGYIQLNTHTFFYISC